MSGFTLRISLIPTNIPEDQFFKVFRNFIDKSPGGGKIIQRSFAPSATSADREKDRVATVSIESVTQILRKEGPIHLQWAGRNITVIVDSSFIGLTPLSNPIEEVTIDIIAITGLAGHAFGSWKAHGVSEMWLRDFLPADVPAARILTYGYDSKVLHSESVSSVFDFATRFLEALKTARAHEDERNRPIIFIAHSLGGLVVKQALVNAALGSDEDKQIHVCCYGLVFFGVPNRGLTNKALERMVKGQPNARLIEDLAPESRLLHQLNNDFSRFFTFEDSPIISIFETKKTKAYVETTLGKWEKVGPAGWVVNESSATSSGRNEKCFDQFSIDEDHSGITKFSTRSNQDFINVRHRILRLVQDAPDVIKKRFTPHGDSSSSRADCGINEGVGSILQLKRKLSVEVTEARKKPEIDRGNLLAWLSKLEPEDDRERIYAKRHENTGQWFLESVEVRKWAKTKSPCMLWCHGKPGVGKSVLTSILLSHIISKYSSNDQIGIAFFYFNFQSKAAQEPTKVLSILLKQFCRHKKDIPQSLIKLYKQCTKDDKAPRFAELQVELRAIIDSFEEVFIVIDAIDECDESHRKQFLPYIVKLFQQSSGRLKVFVASRPEKDIVRTFMSGKFETIKIEAKKVDEDIAIYVRHELQHRQHDYCEIDRDLYSEIEEVLVSQSSGMFLWVKCQLDHLYQQPSKQDIRNALKSLPTDMATTYFQILGRINKQPEVMKTIAIRALTWVITARRPLKPRELAIAVAIEPGSTSISVLGEKYAPQVAIDACCGLLSLEGYVVRPIHFTVQQFLKGPEGCIGNDVEANTELAQSSIRYMLCKGVTISHLYGGRTMSYIWSFWDYHIRDLPKPLPNDSRHLLLDFFSSKNRLNAYRMKRLKSTISVLCLCSKLDLLQVYANLHPLNDASIGLDDLKEAARIAAREGFVSAIAILLDLMDSANTKDNELLFLAVKGGHKETVQLLLDRGADIDACLDEGPVLYRAVLFNNLDLVKMLCEKGANTNIFTERWGTCLYAAAGSRIHVSRCNHILTKGGSYQDDENIPHNPQCSKNHTIVETLLAHGADISIEDGKYGTALQAAVVENNERTVRTLLENGADVNIEGGEYETALYAAVYNNSETITRILVENGADVNIKGGDHGTLLHAAVYVGNEKIVRILLKGGADVNIKSERHRTALQNAESYGKKKIVRILLENGADINIRGGDYGSFLQAPAYLNNNETILRSLVENNAGTNIQGGVFSTAIHNAIISETSNTSFRGSEDYNIDVLNREVEGLPSQYGVPRSYYS